MTLDIGTRLGSYQILAKLGAGGMGEVYRARDTKLHREVAIKVLPAPLSSDQDRLARLAACVRACCDPSLVSRIARALRRSPAAC